VEPNAGRISVVNHGALEPPETDDPIDLSPFARVGGDPRTLKRASKLIRWLTVAAVIVALVSACPNSMPNITEKQAKWL
jgi:hypothetical protein